MQSRKCGSRPSIPTHPHHTGGGTLNQVMKTGTNTVHGSAWEYNQPNTLTANDFFNNAKGVQRPVSHLNQYGLTAGGPIWIPKVLNGKNKLFWFFAFEGMKDGQPNPVFLTIPTAAERTGNLSQFLTSDKTQLYDPYSAVVSGTTITRSPIPNNIIPTNELSPVAQAYLKYYPSPNAAGRRTASRTTATARSPTITTTTSWAASTTTCRR